MQRTSRSYLTLGFIAGWLMILAVSIHFLLGLDDDSDEQGPSIAEVAQSQGDVETRGEDALMWSEAHTGHKLPQGSHLATGASGAVAVVFRDGRRLQLGKHTQVVISESISNGQSTMVVSLIKGNLTALPPVPARSSGAPTVRKLRARIASEPTATPAPLVIRSNGKMISMANLEDQLEVAKPAAGPIVITKASSGLKIERDTIPVPAVVAAVVTKPTIHPQVPAPSANTSGTGTSPLGERVVNSAGSATNLSAVAAVQALPPAPPVPAVITVQPLAASLPAAAAPATLTPRAEVVAGATPPLVTEGMAPRMPLLASNLVYWTQSSLHTAGHSFALTLTPPANIPKGVTWQPYVKARINGREFTVTGQPGGEQTLTLPLPKSRASAGPFARLELVVGANLEQDQGHKASVERRALTLTLGSLSDLAVRGPLTLHVAPGEASAAPNQRGGWRGLPAVDEQAPLTLRLASGTDLPRLEGMIMRSAGFSVGSSDDLPPPGSGPSFVRGNGVVATAWGPRMAQEQAGLLIRTLAGYFGATLAFRGAPTAYITRPDGPDFLTRLAAQVHHQVYVYDHRPGEASYLMHALTLLDNPDIAEYVEAGTVGIFSTPVELVPLLSTAH